MNRLPNMGTMFKKATYAYNPSGFSTLSTYNSLDFTIEAWFRFEYDNPMTKGTISTIFGK